MTHVYLCLDNHRLKIFNNEQFTSVTRGKSVTQATSKNVRSKVTHQRKRNK